MRIRVEWRAGATGLDWSLRAWLITALLWMVMAGLAAERLPPPKFLHTPGILSEHTALELDVRVEPHPRLRAVTLEAWEATADLSDDPDMPTLYLPSVLRSSDSQPVTDLTAHKRTWRFLWRQGLDAGVYVLVAKAVLAQPYQTVETRRTLIVQ